MAFKESSMTSDGIPFGGDGPVMSGTWVNPKTGHKFTVQDCFFQDGQFTVQTTSGQLLDYNTIKEYVQCTDSNGKQVESNAHKSKQQNLPKSVLEEVVDSDNKSNNEDMTEEDAALVGKSLGNINTPRTQPDALQHPTEIFNTPAPTANTDMQMIDRVLHRHQLPQLLGEVHWEKCPTKQIETLIDVLGIDPQEITNYYISQLDKEAIFKFMKQALYDYINKVVSDNVTISEPSSQEPVKKEPVKKTRTTAKKSTTK